MALATAAGAASVLAFSPFDLPLIGLAAIVLLVQLWLRALDPRAAALLGWCFGLGQFGVGVSWVYVSLSRFGGMPVVLAAAVTLLFCAYLALFPAAVGWLQARSRLSTGWRFGILLPALWVIAEWLRSHLLTGFPWLALGTAALGTPLEGYAPVGGVSLVSLASVACGCWASLSLQTPRRWPAVAALVALLAVGAGLRGIIWTEPVGAPTTVSLLQGNVPQDLKFDPRRYATTLDTYARLATTAPGRITILPETALPRFLDQIDPGYIERLSGIARARNGDLMLGVPVRDSRDRYTNSVITLGRSPTQRYDKAHLVPFGEFVPPGLQFVLGSLSIPLSNFSRGADNQRPIVLGSERVAVNICYEDAYAGAIARQAREATLLVNISNVAWFGDSLAPAQHLQIARFRALETGRMHLTATNTGITAVIDRNGAVVASLPQFIEGRLDALAQGYRGDTPYLKWGDSLVLALTAALLALAAVVARTRQSR